MLYTGAEIVAWITAAFGLGLAVAWAAARARHRRPPDASPELPAAGPDPAPTVTPPPRALQRQVMRLHEANAAKDATIERLTAELEQTARGTSDATVTRVLDELAARTDAERVKDRAIAQLAADLTAATDAAQEHQARRAEAEAQVASLRSTVIDLEIALADLEDELALARQARPTDEPAETVGGGLPGGWSGGDG